MGEINTPTVGWNILNIVCIGGTRVLPRRFTTPQRQQQQERGTRSSRTRVRNSLSRGLIGIGLTGFLLRCGRRRVTHARIRLRTVVSQYICVLTAGGARWMDVYYYVWTTIPEQS